MKAHHAGHAEQPYLTTGRFFLTNSRLRNSTAPRKQLILVGDMEKFFRYKLDHIFFWAVTVFFHAYTHTDLIARAGYTQFFLEIVLRKIGRASCRERV